jgi:hypothetical protein
MSQGAKWVDYRGGYWSFVLGGGLWLGISPDAAAGVLVQRGVKRTGTTRGALEAPRCAFHWGRVAFFALHLAYLNVYTPHTQQKCSQHPNYADKYLLTSKKATIAEAAQHSLYSQVAAQFGCVMERPVTTRIDPHLSG